MALTLFWRVNEWDLYYSINLYLLKWPRYTYIQSIYTLPPAKSGLWNDHHRTRKAHRRGCLYFLYVAYGYPLYPLYCIPSDTVSIRLLFQCPVITISDGWKTILQDFLELWNGRCVSVPQYGTLFAADSTLLCGWGLEPTKNIILYV